MNPYSNDVFSVSKGGIKIKYHFDFGKYGLNTDMLKGNDKRPFIKLGKNGIIESLDYFCETKRYLTFPIGIKGCTFYYDKKKQRKMLFRKSSVFNWLEELCFPPFLYSAKKENVFITGLIYIL